MHVPLRIRLALAISAVTALALAASAWLLLDVNRDAMGEATREQLFANIGDISHTMSSYLNDRESELTTIALTLANERLDPDQRIAVVSSRVQASSAIAAVGVYDDRGELVDEIREPSATKRAPPRLDESLRAEALGRALAVGPISYGEDGAYIVLVTAVPGEQTTWFVRSDASLAELQERVAQLADDNLGGDSDGLAMVDGDLRFVAHPDPERVGAPARGVGDWLGPGFFSMGDLAIFREVDGPRGRVVVAARRVADAPWVVLAQRPRSEVYASIDRMRRTVAVVFAVMLMIAVAVAFVIARRVTRPVARLVEFSNALAERQWDRHVTLRAGNELDTLAEAMSLAATRLAAGEEILERERRIRSDLGRFLPAGLVDRIATEEHSLALGGQRREVTVLFADVTSFTRLAEQRPPEQIVQLLNQLFSILTEIVFRHGGTVDKFIGDCVMAVWGAPTAHEDHPERAVRAAQDMIRWLEVGNELWSRQLGATIHLAIGINSGEAIVGNLGSETRMEYTCVGDVVNVAARLEALARPQQILISGATKARVPQQCTALGTRDLAGRTDSIELFEVQI